MSRRPPPTPARVHRRTHKRTRTIRRAVSASTAAEALGPIEPGCEIFGLWKGQFDLVDLIQACIEATGPADVVVSTWSASGSDIDFAHALLADGRVRSLRFIVDYSFGTRQPAYCAALRERFGDEAIRFTRSHAKFTLIENERWSLVLRTSANLNRNRRLENFELSDDPELAAYVREIVESVFAEDAALDAPAGHHERAFADADFGGEQQTFFSDERYGVDLRRVGVTSHKEPR